jgi:cysteine desulfurase/selenocysteine lyase
VFIDCDEQGRVNPAKFADACTEPTALVCLTHASNAVGTIQPVKEVAQAVRAAVPDALILVDCAQTLGHIPVDVKDMDIDLLAIAGHKGLGGPTGTGALYLSTRAYPDNCSQDGSRVFCERRGGTGSLAPGLDMPTQLPDALEAGTSNAVGFAGLNAAMDAHDPAHHDHDMMLTKRILDGLGKIERLTLYGTLGTEGRTPVVLFNIVDICPREVSSVLDRKHGIAVRGGIHCAPLTHDALGIGTSGGVRVSPGHSTTSDEIDRFLEALDSIAAGSTTNA